MKKTMITFKQKNYVIPEEERFVKPRPFPIPDEWKQYEFRMEIVELSSYKREVNSRTGSMWKEWRTNLKRVRKEIKEKHVYDDDPKSRIPSDTHYYPAESEERRRYYTSKSINGTDRLMYDVYSPRLTKDLETEEMYILQLITLNFCIGHTHRNGKKFSEK